MVDQETYSLCAITYTPHVLFRQANTYISPFGLLIQIVIVNPANVLAFNGIYLPVVAIRGWLSEVTAPFFETFFELFSNYALE